jgi:hypothetical protein
MPLWFWRWRKRWETSVAGAIMYGKARSNVSVPIRMSIRLLRSTLSEPPKRTSWWRSLRDYGGHSSGKKHCSLGPCEKLPIGICSSRQRQWYGDEHSYHLAFENFPLSWFHRQKRPWMSASNRLSRCLPGTESATQIVRLQSCMQTDRGMSLEHILRRQITFINKRSDCSDFYLPIFPYSENLFRPSLCYEI